MIVKVIPFYKMGVMNEVDLFFFPKMLNKERLPVASAQDWDITIQ